MERQYHLESLVTVNFSDLPAIQFHQNVAQWIEQFTTLTVPGWQTFEQSKREAKEPGNGSDYMQRDSGSQSTTD